MMNGTEVCKARPSSDPMTGIASFPTAGSADSLSSLPLELQRRIVSFLHPVDAVNLTESRVLQDRIVVRALHPDRHLESPGRFIGLVRTGDRPQSSYHRLRLVANISNDIVHSMTLRARWKDQGWGNQKGKLYVVANPQLSTQKAQNDAVPSFFLEGEENVNRVLFDGGRVVATTAAFAPHQWEPVELTFTPREGEVYYLWFSAGAGGGHVLHLEDLCLQTHVYDDMDHSFSKTYEVLYNLDVVSCSSLKSVLPPHCPLYQSENPLLPNFAVNFKARYFQAERRGENSFYPNLLLRVVQSGLRQLAVPASGIARFDPALEFLSENGLQMNEATLQAAETIIQSYIDELNYDWLVYELQRQKFRSLHPGDYPTGQRRRRATSDAQRFELYLGNEIPPNGAIRATMNGFRIVAPVRNNGVRPPGANGGEGIHVERIPPPPGVAEGNAVPPQVVNNPDGTFSIRFGNMGENVGVGVMEAIGLAEAEPQAAPPPAEFFGLAGAAAAIAAAFGFNNNNNENPPAPGNVEPVVIQEFIGGGDDFGPAAALFAAMAGEMGIGPVPQDDGDMDEDAEEVFAQ